VRRLGLLCSNSWVRGEGDASGSVPGGWWTLDVDGGWWRVNGYWSPKKTPANSRLLLEQHQTIPS